MIDHIAAYCLEHRLPFDAVASRRFGVYLELLEKLNAGMNLIGPLSRAEIVEELLIDSIVPARVVAPSESILDVGTGAGLPGIPLKILFPSLPITLVEPRRKRSTFLKICQKRLDLEHVTIHEARIEDVPPGKFGYVISKAFEPPLDWIETASHWRADDGVVVCMTRMTERAGLEAKAGGLGLSLKGALDGERAVYVFGR
jgi:16S rRNA (guanine527-N7)-methyltransferase